MSPDTTADDEALYRRACEIASRKRSVAYLQRSLGGGIGYQRTTALLERMVAEGLIANYAGRRECDAAMKQAPSGAAPIRDRLRHALLDGGVALDQKRLVLIFDPRQPGDNILQQVLNRLQSCWPVPLPDEMHRQMIEECGDDYERRGIFASGWLGAEQAYSITTACRPAENVQEHPKTTGGPGT